MKAFLTNLYQFLDEGVKSTKKTYTILRQFFDWIVESTKDAYAAFKVRKAERQQLDEDITWSFCVRMFKKYGLLPMPRSIPLDRSSTPIFCLCMVVFAMPICLIAPFVQHSSDAVKVVSMLIVLFPYLGVMALSMYASWLPHAWVELEQKEKHRRQHTETE